NIYIKNSELNNIGPIQTIGKNMYDFIYKKLKYLRFNDIDCHRGALYSIEHSELNELRLAENERIKNINKWNDNLYYCNYILDIALDQLVLMIPEHRLP